MHSDQRRIEFLDFGKAFAILTIVLMHYTTPWVQGFAGKALLFGGSGVHLFFLASGFGLTLAPKSSASTFYRKRLPHLLAPYFIVVTLSFFINQFHPYFGNDGLYALGGHLLLYKMFDERIVASLGYQFWFMSTIIQFYVVFPLLRAALLSTTRKRFVGGGLVISCSYWVMIAALGVADMRVYNSFFLQYLWEFCLGIALADYYKSTNDALWQKPAVPTLAVAIAGMALMAVMALKGGAVGRLFNDIPASLGYIALSAFVYQVLARWCRPLKDAVVKLGSFSYELYMVHILILLVAVTVIGSHEAPVMLACSLFVVFPLALGAAWAFSVFNRRIVFQHL